MILAGDIGGTKTVLALYQRQADNSLSALIEQTFSSSDFSCFDDILDSFLPTGLVISSACLGVAGPVVNGVCQTTNLPWLLDTRDLQNKLGTDQVKLLNDLETMALGMLHLPDSELIELNPLARKQTGNIAVIAAGTGLGEAILFWNGEYYAPMATEGGHCDLAAQTPEQDRLLVFLRQQFPEHVSCERIISGIGFSHLYDFVCADGIAPPCPAVPEHNSGIDRNAMISRLGVQGEDEACRAAVRLFVSLYGAEAGNLALKSLAVGGVFIGGGIAPKILPALQEGGFISAFKAKGRFYGLLESVSVQVATNPKTPLIGASHYFDAL